MRRGAGGAVVLVAQRWPVERYYDAGHAAYRAFTYSSGSVVTGPGTSINGLFLPGNQAQGQASFVNYPGCGTAAAEWTATRR